MEAGAGGNIASRARGESGHPITAWLVDHTPRPVRAPVRVVAATVDDAVDDRAAGLAAEVAFFAILSLPPLLLTVVAGLGFLPGDQTSAFVDGMLAAARRVFSAGTVEDMVEPTLRAVVASQRTDVLSLGFAVAVYSASRAVRVVLTAVALAYDLGGRRPSWAQRIYALLATLCLLAVVPVFFPLLLAGPGLGDRLVDGGVLPPVAAAAWPPLYWLLVGVGAVLAVAGLYHLAAPWWTPYRRDLPGAALAVLLWLASSAGLRLYSERALTGNELFSVLASPLVLLVWLYLLALAVILGAELNAELERLYPSPEQQRAPAAERLKRRIDSTAARIEDTLPLVVDRVRDRVGRDSDDPA